MAVQGGSRYLQSDWMGKFLKAFPKKWAVQAAVQGGSGYMPLERMYIFPKALQKWWFRRRFRTVQDTYQLGGCAKFPRLPLRRGGSGGNSERYVQIPQRRLDKLGRMSARAKILKADFDFLQT